MLGICLTRVFRLPVVACCVVSGCCHEGGFFLYLSAIWGRVGFVDKCWRMSLRSLLVCATIWGFRPSPPPFFLSACRGEENLRGHVLCSLLGGVWAQEATARRVVVCGDGVL